MDDIDSLYKNNTNKGESRALRGIHSQINSIMGYSVERNNAHIEDSGNIRKHLSTYSLQNKQYVVNNSNDWDRNNYGGIPLDFDNESRTVYVDSSDAHTLLIGSTGSKKSRLVAIPSVLTIASAGESLIICDPKGEIYNRSSAELINKGYSISVLNLREPEYSDSWNILTIPYRYYCDDEVDKACEYVNDFAINFIPLYAKDPYWDYSARDLLFGLTLLLFKISKKSHLPLEKVNIASVLELRQLMFSSTDSDRIMNSDLWKIAEEEHLIKNRLIGTVICPDRTLSCILSTFDQHLSCFSMQPMITKLLSQNTLNLDDLGKTKKAVFLIMPDEKTTYHKIVSVFIKESYEYLINSIYKGGTDNRFPVRINYILDEFSSLPKISDFPQMIAAARSRNIRFLLIVQSKHQLIDKYEEEAQTIQSNCSNWMFLFSREISLLDEVSELCGKINGEPLISPSLLQHLNKEEGECLLLLGRYSPYLAHLPDIDQYGDVLKPPQAHKRAIREQPVEVITKEDILEKITKKNISKTDLQYELEKKYDELFGSDSEDNPSQTDGVQ